MYFHTYSRTLSLKKIVVPSRGQLKNLKKSSNLGCTDEIRVRSRIKLTRILTFDNCGHWAAGIATRQEREADAARQVHACMISFFLFFFLCWKREKRRTAKFVHACGLMMYM